MKDNQTNTAYTDQEKEFLDKAGRIHAKLQEAPAGNAEPFREQIPENEAVTLAELKKSYNIPPNFYEEDDGMVLYQGDLYLDGDLDEEWFEEACGSLADFQGELYGIVVDGHLTVNGDITADMPVLHVTKDLRCDYLFTDYGNILVEGVAYIRHGVYGEDNGGYFEVGSALAAPYIISNDHAMPFESTICESIYIHGGDGNQIRYLDIGDRPGSGEGWGWYYMPRAETLLDPAVGEGGKFSVERFFGMVRRGQNPFACIQ